MSPLSLGLLLLTETVSAPAGRLAIVPIVDEGARASFEAEAVHGIFADEARYRGSWRQVPYNELLLSGEGARDDIRDCGANAMCVAQALFRTDATAALVVIVTRPREAIIVTATHLNRETSAVDAEIAVRLSANDASGLSRAARELFDELSRPVYGMVQVEVEPKDTQLRWQPPAERLDPLAARYVARPGAYDLALDRTGYESRVERVTIDPRTDAKLTFALRPDAPPTSVWKSPWLWSGVAVGVAAVATTVLLVALPRDPNQTCLSSNPDLCP